MKSNDRILFRTAGRGVVRVWKGTIQKVVKAGTLLPENLRGKIPHGEKLSNRDRYAVKLDKGGTLAWANATGPNAVREGDKLPTYKPRHQKKTKTIAKDNSKVAKAVKKRFRVIDKKVKANLAAAEKPRVLTVTYTQAAPTKRSGGEKPKTTWYGLVDGKVVSVRKVICPEGFSKDKPVATPAVPAAETAQPQASVV